MIETKENFDENSILNSIIFLKDNFINLSKEDFDYICDKIENSDILPKLFEKEFAQLTDDEKKTITEYCETVLRLKTMFYPKSLENNSVVESLMEGKITDPNILKLTVENLPLKTINSYISYDSKKGEVYFFYLANFLKSKNFSDKNIAEFAKIVLDKVSNYDISELLEKIDFPKSKKEFIESEHFNGNEWIEFLFDENELGVAKEKIDTLYKPVISLDYYTKSIESHDADENFKLKIIDSLTELLKSKIPSSEEKETIKTALRNNSISKKYITDEEIVFSKDDAFSDLIRKVKLAYYNGKNIPDDVSKKIFTNILYLRMNNYEERFLSHEDSNILLKSATRSYISSKMKDLGIERQVFFGNAGIEKCGYDSPGSNITWISENAIDTFGVSSWELPNTMFHEMNHAVQDYNISKGQIDYLTYCILKENLVFNNDTRFYAENYSSLLVENDSNVEGILGRGKFLKEIYDRNVIDKQSILKFEELRKEQQELKSYNTKKIVLGDKEFDIDISKYISKLIQFNPDILRENPVLNIEYENNGERKDIGKMLEDFFSYHEDRYGISYDNLYLIYSGLINERIKEGVEIDGDLKAKIDKFNSMNLVSINVLKQYYDEVNPLDIEKAISRFEITQFQNKNLLNRGNAEDDKRR